MGIIIISYRKLFNIGSLIILPEKSCPLLALVLCKGLKSKDLIKRLHILAVSKGCIAYSSLIIFEARSDGVRPSVFS